MGETQSKQFADDNGSFGDITAPRAPKNPSAFHANQHVLVPIWPFHRMRVESL